MTNLTKFATRHGVHRTTVKRWEDKGLMVRDAGGNINVKASDRILESCGLGRFKTIQSSDAGPMIGEIQKRKQFALMRKRELEVLRLEERLIDADRFRRETWRITKRVLQQLSEIPACNASAIAADLGVCPDAVTAALGSVMKKVLSQIWESTSELSN